jgi:hypothetical protein
MQPYQSGWCIASGPTDGPDAPIDSGGFVKLRGAELGRSIFRKYSKGPTGALAGKVESLWPPSSERAAPLKAMPRSTANTTETRSEPPPQRTSLEMVGAPRSAHGSNRIDSISTESPGLSGSIRNDKRCIPPL